MRHAKCAHVWLFGVLPPSLSSYEERALPLKLAPVLCALLRAVRHIRSLNEFVVFVQWRIYFPGRISFIGVLRPRR